MNSQSTISDELSNGSAARAPRRPPFLAFLSGLLTFTIAVFWSVFTTPSASGQPAASPAPAATANTKAPDSASHSTDSDPDDADESDKWGKDWVRVASDDHDRVVGMQTAIIRYVPASAPAGDESNYLDLIGAVHVGDKQYYDQLNKRFEQYDALLYELVMEEGTVVERGRGTSNTHPLGALQNGMKTVLELDHQLEDIDYTKDNFVHADMSPEAFAQSMRDRQEGFLQLYFKLLGQGIAHQSRMAAKGESMDVDLLAALFSSNRARALKVAMAKQMAEVESLVGSLGGEEGSTLISERNKVALQVLRKQLDAGKKKLGIFYGAAHLNDMDERLRRDFGMKPVSITWLTAWDLAE